MEDNFKICLECSNIEAVKEEIIKLNHTIDNCDFCSNQNLIGLNQDTIYEIIPYLEAYFAYYYPQSDWDGRYGLRNYMDTIYQEEIFFNWKKIEQNEKYESLFCSLDNYDSTTLIYDDHWASPWALADKEYHPLLNSLTSEDNFKNKLKATVDLISNAELMIKSKKTNIKGYRARIGCNQTDGDYGRKINTPYVGKEIGVAPKYVIDSGRANRAFCGFLYLAEDIKTSILEVRAQKGDYVSIGEFHSKKELQIFDLTSPNIDKYKKDFNTLKKLELISAINSLFSKPTGNSNSSIYLDTQLIVEEIIRKNYDGICFKSSFTGNKNYTLFNVDLMNEQCDKGKLYQLDKMEITISEYNKDPYDL